MSWRWVLWSKDGRPWAYFWERFPDQGKFVGFSDPFQSFFFFKDPGYGKEWYISARKRTLCSDFEVTTSFVHIVCVNTGCVIFTTFFSTIFKTRQNTGQKTVFYFVSNRVWRVIPSLLATSVRPIVLSRYLGFNFLLAWLNSRIRILYLGILVSLPPVTQVGSLKRLQLW